MDDAIGLKYVGDGDHGSAALFVLQFDVLAIVQGDQSLPPSTVVN